MCSGKSTTFVVISQRLVILFVSIHLFVQETLALNFETFLQEKERCCSPDLFDEDATKEAVLEEKEECARENDVVSSTGYYQNRTVPNRQYSRPLFRKGQHSDAKEGKLKREISAALESEDLTANVGKCDDISHVGSAKEKQKTPQKGSETNQGRRYSLRKSTPSKRQEETKNRTSRALIGCGNVMNKSDTRDISGAIDKLLGVNDAQEETDDLPGMFRTTRGNNFVSFCKLYTGRRLLHFFPPVCFLQRVTPT